MVQGQRVVSIGFLLLSHAYSSFAGTSPDVYSKETTDSVTTKSRSITNIANGIYMIRHEDAPDLFPQGNTTVIIGNNEVLVVDACYLPSSAKQDIDQIRKWTNKPVRWLVNTHWHYDHTMGNGTYANEFPGIHIVAHTETRNQIVGYNPGWFERFPSRGDRFQKMLDDGKDESGNALTEADIKELKDAIAGIQPVQNEFKKIIDAPPNVTFDSEMTIDLGDRIVELKFLGRGNTAGDAVVFLPAEKILIVGDLLDYPVPYLGGGFPTEEIVTLKKMRDMDALTFIPGHGIAVHGKEYLSLVIDLMTAVVEEVSKQVYKLGNDSRKLDVVQEAVMKNINLKFWKEKFGQGNKENESFFEGFALSGLIKAAYAEMWRR